MSLVYIGTYTRRDSKGIYACRFDPASGKLSGLELAAPMDNPSFLAIHPTRPYLYAVSEIKDYLGGQTGAVAAFRVEPGTGKLVPLGQVSSGGTGPCRLVVDPSGQNVLVANYAGGSVAVLPLKPNGALGPASAVIRHSGSSEHPVRQNEPHVHSVQLSADKRLAFVTDLGLDRIFLYAFDPETGSLATGSPPFVQTDPGAGPRHLVLHPHGPYAYVVNELHSTVTAFSWDNARCLLKHVQTTSTLPSAVSTTSTAAEIRVHPAGRFLYVSNRGHDSIAVMAVKPGDGSLRVVQHVSSGGEVPRHFEIDPSGAYLVAANQASHLLAVLRIDPATGLLKATSERLAVDCPACVAFLDLKGIDGS